MSRKRYETVLHFTRHMHNDHPDQTRKLVTLSVTEGFGRGAYLSANSSMALSWIQIRKILDDTRGGKITLRLD